MATIAPSPNSIPVLPALSPPPPTPPTPPSSPPPISPPGPPPQTNTTSPASPPPAQQTRPIPRPATSPPPQSPNPPPPSTSSQPPPPLSSPPPSSQLSSPPARQPPSRQPPITSPSPQSANLPAPSSSSPPPIPSPPPSSQLSSPPAQRPASTLPPLTSPSPQSANPPAPSSSSPPPISSPPPSSQPSPSSTPPSSPPLPPSAPTPTGSQSPPSITPPIRSPPPPLAASPPIPSPPPLTDPPAISPPPSSISPPTSSSPPPQRRNAPPPPSTSPPESSPPPPSSQAPRTSPPPPSSNPPETSPPPPASIPPQNSPPPPASNPPERSPPPALPPSSNVPPGALLPPPPPRSGEAPLLPSPPSPSLVPSGDPSTNTSTTNTSDNSRSTGSGGIGTGGTIAIGLIIGVLLLSFIGTAAWCIWRRKKKASGPDGGYVLPTSSPKSDSGLLKMEMSVANAGTSSGSDIIYSPPEPGGLGHSRSWFTYEELMEATNGFSEQNLLGEGGFGTVYKGCLADGREVAIKQLKIGGGQGEQEFRAEVDIISRIHHRHLVSLVGYCISEYRRMLVYDYVPNNTLHFHLHGEGRPVMDWATRVKIAVGAARGIAYLHEDCHPRIIHRDIKSSNILLDNSFEARVSDFGLAKLFQDSNTHITTRVMGTFGYMAPEYASSGKLTEKSDVFSFGVVLLELITGRKPVDTSQPLGEESLVEWARPLLRHAIDTEEFEELVDPRLEKKFVDPEMFRLIEVAAACVRHSATKRPQMGQVVRAIDSMATADLTNGMRVGESEIFNTAQQSLFQRMAFGNQDYSTDFFSQSGYSS